MLDVRRLSYFVALPRPCTSARRPSGFASRSLRSASRFYGWKKISAASSCGAIADESSSHPPGLALLETGRPALLQMVHAGEAARRTAASHASLLRIGFLSPAAFAVVPDVLRRLRLAHPAVFLVLREGDSVTLLEEVRLGLLDIAFVRGPITWPGVRIDTLSREPLVMVLPSGHRLARGTRVPLAQVADEPFIGFPRDTAPSLHDAITGMCQEAGFTPTFVTEASEWYTMVSLVAAGIGLTLLPKSIRTFQRRGAVYRSVAGHQRHVEVAVARRHGPPGAALRACLQTVAQVTGVHLL